MASKNTRRPLGFVSHPRVQIKYGLLNALTISLLMTFVYLISFINLRTLLDPAPRDELLYYSIKSSITLMTWTAVLMTAAAFFLTFISTLILVHRFIGPAIPIRRFIDSLIQGERPQPLKLRRYDELGLVAEKLNELAEKLHGSSEPKEGQKD